MHGYMKAHLTHTHTHSSYLLHSSFMQLIQIECVDPVLCTEDQILVCENKIE